jgi:hypothetical protein
MTTLYVDNIAPNLQSKISAPNLTLPTGSVIQVTEADGSGATSTTTGSWINIMSATITPTSSSSKILVISHYTMYGGGTGRIRANGKLKRGTSDIFQTNEIFFRETSGQFKSTRSHIMELDSPASTSAVTYHWQIYLQNCDGGNDFTVINPKITLMEIAG